MDSKEYRYRAFISDIAGQDIRAHNGDPEEAIREVRNWLQATSRRTGLTGGGELIKRYRRFKAYLPGVCVSLSLEPDKLTFLDLCRTIIDWLRTYP